MIETKNLTKDFGHGRGVFDVTVDVAEGECFGFLGPNGAGKTTLIRHLMGFTRPQQGTAEIDGMDCYKYSAVLQKRIGYLPGEIALPTGQTGRQFLNMLCQMRDVRDRSLTDELVDRFRIDIDQETKRMSLGNKRKLAIAAAFLHDPEILILDEPTSGLDPLMQQTFIDYIKEQKKRGKTIFMSSHIFREVDACCDRIAIIKDGRVLSIFTANSLRTSNEIIYRVTFNNEAEMDRFLTLPYDFTNVNREKMRVRVRTPHTNIQNLIHDIGGFDVKDFVEIPYTLEDYFMSFYKEDKKFAEVKA